MDVNWWRYTWKICQKGHNCQFPSVSFTYVLGAVHYDEMLFRGGLNPTSPLHHRKSLLGWPPLHPCCQMSLFWLTHPPPSSSKITFCHTTLPCYKTKLMDSLLPPNIFYLLFLYIYSFCINRYKNSSSGKGFYELNPTMHNSLGCMILKKFVLIHFLGGLLIISEKYDWTEIFVKID